MQEERITIKATPQTVFQAIRQHRNDEEPHRRLQSFDGKTAIIHEDLEGVPIFGKVHCVWQEEELPFSRIDYRLVSSSKFKESYGSWILTPTHNGDETVLELKTYIDPGLNVPFAHELTKISTSRDSKSRLERVKTIAEALKKQTVQISLRTSGVKNGK